VFPVRYELGFYIPGDGILHSHRRENLRFYTELTGWALWRRSNVFPVRYELFIPEDMLHTYRHQSLKSYIVDVTYHFRVSPNMNGPKVQ
jgi:hypothetical protein